MRIFLYELRKIWSLKLLLVLAVIAVPYSIVALIGQTSSYEALSHYGSYGEYLSEMYDKYGETLEPEELADFNIESVRTDVIAEANRIIAANSVFSENGVTDWDGYIKFLDHGEQSDWTQEQLDSHYVALIAMSHAFAGVDDHITPTIQQSYNGANFRMQSLESIERSYINYKPGLQNYVDFDLRPVVVKTAQNLIEQGNVNLANNYLARSFSMYAASVAILAVIAVMLLVAPMIVTDRAGGVTLLQYSSKAGREVFSIQLGATMFSAFALSVILCALSTIPWGFTDALKYWDAHLMMNGDWGLFLYNVTFGQYAMILFAAIVALCVTAAAVAFILARFSQNAVTLMLKSVPVAAALCALAYIAMYLAFNAANIVFTSVFRGAVVAPEVIVCGVVFVLCTVAAVMVARRERKVDVA